MRMPVPASAHALCCWGHLPLTASTQKGFGMPRCIEMSRIMLVLLGAPFSYTVSTSEALVRENASITFGSCPVLMGHLLRKESTTLKPW